MAGVFFSLTVTSWAIDFPVVGVKVYKNSDSENPGKVKDIYPVEIECENWSNSVTVYLYLVDESDYSGYYLLKYESDKWVMFKGDQDFGHIDNTEDASTINDFKESFIKRYGAQDVIDGLVNDHYTVKINYTHTYPIPSPDPHEHVWQRRVIYPASEGVAGLEGDCCDCGAIRNTSPIPAGACIMDNRLTQIKLASPSKTNILEMKTLNSLPGYFMLDIANHPDCDFVLTMIYDGKVYAVTIPKGTKFDTSLDWYGPDQLLKQFDYKILTDHAV